jgi:superfamily II DNA or RNA helicase
VYALVDKLKSIQSFRSKKLLHEGSLKVPIGWMVVLPNVFKKEFLDKGLHGLIPPKRILFRDDLDHAGEILCDPTGCKFVERMSHAFPFKFGGLQQKEVDNLHSAIWPEMRIDLPERKGEGKPRFQKEVQALDDAQARIALHLRGGHQIIKGPPGSGKSLVLIHRCHHLNRYNPQVKKILFVCYNITLVSYLKRLLQEKGLGVGSNGIQVCHFYELCSHILAEEIEYEGQDPEYYETHAQLALEAVQSQEHSLGEFDAILVDEGQDFDNDMLKTLMGLLQPEGDLVIALDAYQ